MEKKNVKIFSAIAIVTLALLVVGATYAYFQNQYGASSNADVSVTTYTTDVLTFETRDAINITADQESFAQGKGNRTGSTFARATLQANNKTNTATANYYMYLNIETNTFTYTNTGTPELLLQIIDKTSGNPVTSITGLDYITVTDGKNTSISGFDITTKKGLIALFSNKEISASPKTVEEYTVTITLVNHSFDQNNNTGKNLSGKLIIQKEKMITSISDVAKNGDNLVTVLETLGTKGDPSLTGLYYHDANLTNGAGDNSFRYAGAIDVVNNFVCFGSEEENCPVDNLYGIIGVFDNRVKLIKYDYANSNLLGTDGDYKAAYSADKIYYNGIPSKEISGYMWNYNGLSDHTGNNQYGSNTWSTSLFNKTNLNTNYLNNIGSKWAKMIDTTTWKVGGNTAEIIEYVIPSIVYQNEVVKPVTTNSTDNATEYNAKIGLMYVSDFGFAADPSAWTTTLIDYRSARNMNWMYMGLDEWTISRLAEYSNYLFSIYDSGYVNGSRASDGQAVRPVFFLSSSVKFSSGDGSVFNPIRVKL